MKDDELHDLLEALPRAATSEDFTARVLARLDEPARAVPRARWLTAAAVTVLVILGGFTGQYLIAKKQQEERLAAARLERAAIERELREIKRLSDEVSPVVYLGSSGEADYLVDFRVFESSSPTIGQASWAPPNTY